MEEIDIKIGGEKKEEIVVKNNQTQNSTQIAGAIIVAGIIVAGAILLRGSSAPIQAGIPVPDKATMGTTTLAPVTSQDRILGNPGSKVTLIMYEDFQCPYCGRFFKDSEGSIVANYVNTGKIDFVYRDFPFLGPESFKSAEAARCAGDQGKFWQYHDYLFTHQNGENKGAFVDANLKSFAATLGLNTTTFSQCLDSGKYTQAINDSATEGKTAGVNGTPKGFILKNGKIVATIEGAEALATVTAKLDAALK